MAGLFDSERRFLNNLRKNKVPLVAISVGQVMHIGMSYYLVICCELGIQGTGIAAGLTNACVLLVTFTYANTLDEVKSASNGIVWS